MTSVPSTCGSEPGPNANLVVLGHRLGEAIQPSERLGLVEHHLGEADHVQIFGADGRRELRALVVAAILAEQ